MLEVKLILVQPPSALWLVRQHLAYRKMTQNNPNLSKITVVKEMQLFISLFLLLVLRFQVLLFVVTTTSSEKANTIKTGD